MFNTVFLVQDYTFEKQTNMDHLLHICSLFKINFGINLLWVHFRKQMQIFASFPALITHMQSLRCATRKFLATEYKNDRC